ncbi:unnamed protein product [Ilex paraguariensis]|uniref:non-specific serine/threonine protein kinase n=1 Tax=Ilex paraguariensis TaxID=185542 RepID=A0ABC8RJV2_9AQUA
MVSSQLPALGKTRMCKSFQGWLLFPLSPPDVVPSDQVELDFSDVFGPLPAQAPNEVIHGLPEGLIAVANASELVYDDPAVIYNRSHSLVGPSACVSQSLKLSKLTIHESEDSMELVECLSDESITLSANSSVVQEPLVGVDDISKKVQTVGLEDFEVMKVVGQGAFGKVFQVRKRGTLEIFAMKVMRKDKVMEKNHTAYMKAERDILTQIEHPFIVQLRYSFQTKYRLYLVLDFVNGGHLFFQLYHHGLFRCCLFLGFAFVNSLDMWLISIRQMFLEMILAKCFREDLARIYTAEIVSAVSHLHANGIMHRDLKPENILLDADGHTKYRLYLVLDFVNGGHLFFQLYHHGLFRCCLFLGFAFVNSLDMWLISIRQMFLEMILAKCFREDLARIYTAEIVSAVSHLHANGIMHRDLKPENILLDADGHPPFIGGNRGRVQQKITKDKLKLPAFLSSEAHSVLKGLLQKDPNKRLGSGPTDSDEIKHHKWFKSMNWKKLEGREIHPIFRPEVAGKHCIANFDKRWTDMPLLDSPVSSPKQNGNLFQGFTYVRPTASFLQRNDPLN